MARRGRLDVPVIGIAGRTGRPSNCARARESLAEHGGVDEDAYERQARTTAYVTGDYQDPRRSTRFARRSASSRAVVLPGHPAEPVRSRRLGLAESGCARGARLIVEKPFGRDLASARALNATLHDRSPNQRSSASTITWARSRS